MIVLELQNNIGLGNQLFIYANAYALAQKEKQKIYIFSRTYKRNRKYILDLFELDEEKIIDSLRIDKIKGHLIQRGLSFCGKYIHLLFKNFCFIEEKIGTERIYKELPQGRKHYWVRGNFESYKYFDFCGEELRKQYTFRGIISEQTKEWIEKIKLCNNSVALHIRQGDFKELNRCLPLIYYEKAIDFFEKEYKECQFFLITEDKKIAKEFNHNRNIVLVSISDDKDIDIMEWLCLCACKHHIISNSTFSWWAAYLAEYKEKKIVVPSKRIYEQVENRGRMEDFFKPEWIEIG